MPDTLPINIDVVTHDNLDDLLPLIEGYQQFYEAADIDEARNRAFFGQLIDEPYRGIQHIAYAAGQPVGFTTLYFTSASITAEQICTLYDVFVLPLFRDLGYGQQLMEHAAEWSRAAGYPAMNWFTAPDNHRAQAVYDKLPATKSSWLEYEWRL